MIPAWRAIAVATYQRIFGLQEIIGKSVLGEIREIIVTSQSNSYGIKTRCFPQGVEDTVDCIRQVQRTVKNPQDLGEKMLAAFDFLAFGDIEDRSDNEKEIAFVIVFALEG